MNSIFLYTQFKMEWKWTKGEPYERSQRVLKNENIKDTFSKDIELSAYTSSLHHDENTWDILNQDNALNKREDLDFKIADRGLVQQIGNNPFMGQNNYVEDISVSDKFLKPINTSQDRINDVKNS